MTASFPPDTGSATDRLYCMENELFEAAMFGNINSLQTILNRDNLILSKFVAGFFSWSPLLVATSQGHKSFVERLLDLNPDLGKATDSQNRTAIHLAAEKGHIEVVHVILQSLGFGFCLSRDQEGWYPLHVAAVNGRVEVLRELIRVNSFVARARLEQEEMNVLHLCVKHRKFESLKVLIEAIPDYEFVNSRDYLGNTILHLAVYQKQEQVIKYVLDNTQVNDIALNSCGKTALDIAIELGTTAEGLEKRELDSIKGLLGSSARGTRVGHFDWLERKDILMLVASVLASTSFQVAANPPGGLWQDTNDIHRAGESVLAHNYPHIYTYILFTNTFVFLGSVGLMFFLATARNNYFRKRIVVLVIAAYNSTIVCFLAFAYCGSVYAVAPDKGLFNLLSKPINDDEPNLHHEGTNVAVMFVILTFIGLFLFGISFLFYLQWKNRKRIYGRKNIIARIRASPNSNGVTLDSV